MSGGWHYADVFEAVADQRPTATAIVQGERRTTWGDFDTVADAVARLFLAAGLTRQQSVALCLYNGAEYLEAFHAACKIAAVPVNTNHRYGAEELRSLWQDCEAAAVLFHGSLTERVELARAGLPDVRLWVWVDDGTAPCPDWAVPFPGPDGGGRARAPWGRSPTDHVLLYTGGTTGLPKGVVWTQETIIGSFVVRYSPVPVEAGVNGLRRHLESGAPAPVACAPAPLMHYVGMQAANIGLHAGGRVVFPESRHLDPAEVWDCIEAEGVELTYIVGDAFGLPLCEALDAEPDRWDLSRLRTIMSAGVIWSGPVKERLRAHLLGRRPDLQLVDSLGSSEAPALGVRVIEGPDAAPRTAEFALGPNARVIDDDGHDIEPGSGRVGRAAVHTWIPVGYHRDAAKTAATFVPIDGVRHSVPGDYATVAADGTLQLLGRGSVCVNTGGEKVFPEEVEEVLKDHPAVRDAVVVGVPDPRFGEAVTAVVVLDRQVGAPELVDHVKGRLAGYKAPRHVVVVDRVARAENGKADYPALRSLASARVAAVDVPAVRQPESHRPEARSTP